MPTEVESKIVASVQIRMEIRNPMVEERPTNVLYQEPKETASRLYEVEYGGGDYIVLYSTA